MNEEQSEKVTSRDVLFFMRPFKGTIFGVSLQKNKKNAKK